MLSIAHAATGAFIATKVTDPGLAIPLVLLSHYALDAVAHWDVGTGLSSGKRSIKTAILGEIPDLLLAGILVLAMYPSAFPIIHNSYPLIRDFTPIWGAFFGLLPDFLEAPRNFLKYEPFFLRHINMLHHMFHHSIPRPIAGLMPQLILLATLWYFR